MLQPLMRALVLMTAFAVFAVSFPLAAGEYNQVLDIGDEAPSWKDLPGTDGKKHSLGDLKGFPVVMVVFTCNSCPVAQDYEDRTIALAAKYAKRAAVVAINVNRIAEDRLPEMKKLAERKKFQHAYLYDETQQIAKAYGAINTPECFVLSPERKIVYMGAIDDNSQPAKVKHRYAEAAIEATLKGTTPSTEETYANGCAIRFERQRRAKKP